jgi:hypothetical protein
MDAASWGAGIPIDQTIREIDEKQRSCCRRGNQDPCNDPIHRADGKADWAQPLPLLIRA